MHARVLTYIAMRWFLALWCGLGTVQEFLSAVNNKDVNEPVALDKAKQRLQQLEGKVDRVELSQKDMMAQVQKHGADLTTAWKRSERVKSLKISIQVQPLTRVVCGVACRRHVVPPPHLTTAGVCLWWHGLQCAKLLVESSTPHFYPCIFVYVTDVMDKFGDLVYRRILK